MGGYLLACVGVLGYLDFFAMQRLTIKYLWITLTVTGAALYIVGLRTTRTLPRKLSSTTSKDDQRSTLEPQRRQVARQSQAVMTRLRYAETLSTQNEGSATLGKLNLKRSSQRSLSQLPLTEADLVDEFAALTSDLERVGYRVIVTIDEMDKLEAGDSTQEFLNSVKQLFTIRSCSFVVNSRPPWSGCPGCFGQLARCH
jgi:hypothetical protein